MTGRRLILRVLLALPVLAAAALFVLPLRQDGGPLLRWGELKAPGLPELELPSVTFPKAILPQATPDGDAVAVYRWRDRQGIWQYGDAPPEGTPFETVALDPGANLVKGEGAGAIEGAADAEPPSRIEGLNPAAALDRAREARAAMEARYRDQQEAIDRLR